MNMGGQVIKFMWLYTFKMSYSCEYVRFSVIIHYFVDNIENEHIETV